MTQKIVSDTLNSESHMVTKIEENVPSKRQKMSTLDF